MSQEKNAKSNKTNTLNRYRYIVVIATTVVLIIGVVCLFMFGAGVFNNQNSDSLSETFVKPDNQKPIMLSDDIEILSVGKYAGMYFEDGSNDTVTNVMMIQLKNNNSKDLQYATIVLEYGDNIAEFVVTNIPSGNCVIALEKNRKPFTNDNLTTASAQSLAFFSEKMSTCEDVFEIKGANGTLNIKNISKKDIQNDVYIYYKYKKDDLLYGGITYRAKIERGIKTDEQKQVSTNHYNPDECVIVNVTVGA